MCLPDKAPWGGRVQRKICTGSLESYWCSTGQTPLSWLEGQPPSPAQPCCKCCEPRTWGRGGGKHEVTVCCRLLPLLSHCGRGLRRWVELNSTWESVCWGERAPVCDHMLGRIHVGQSPINQDAHVMAATSGQGCKVIHGGAMLGVKAKDCQQAVPPLCNSSFPRPKQLDC